jgi:UDP-GlcNAc:undecaprenyl-phosphate/decaprenyl-phosphate GlcNAc-1-phosphate transferase
MNPDALLPFAVAFLPAFIAVLALVPLARKLALRLNFVDEPGGRKTHDDKVPPIGGLVLFPVYMIAALVSGAEFTQMWPLFAGLGLILVTGVLDDAHVINAWVKFAMQFFAAGIIVITGHAQILYLGNLFGFGNLWLSYASIPFSIVATVLLINAINLMDGLDGLAGGKSFVAFIWLVIACLVAADTERALALMPLMGALGGFLFYNMRHPLRDRACVFLGDAGSMGLGLTLAWFCISYAQKPAPVMPPIVIAWMLAIPIIDTCAQFYRRTREGRHPFSPDRGHFHHHFIHAGIPVGNTTAAILILTFVLGGIGYGGIWLGIPEWYMAGAWILLLFSHMYLSQKPRNYIEFFARFSGETPSGPYQD